MKLILISTLLCLSCAAQEMIIGAMPKPWAPRNGLVGWWPLNEGSGTTTADRAGANTGTLYGSPAWADGKFSKCVQFDGSDDYLLTGSFAFGSSATVSMWVKQTSTADGKMLWDRNDNGRYLLWTNNSNTKMQVFVNGWSSANFTNPLELNTYVHIAVTWTPTTLTVYKNGAYFYGETGLSLSAGGAAQLYFGCMYSGYASAFFAGLMDDIRIYSRALSAAEIAEMHQRSK